MILLKFFVQARGKIRLIIVGSFFLCWVSFSQVGPPIPVLCYHAFASDTGAVQGKLTERFSRFEEMLRFLSAHGYETIFPEELDKRGSLRIKKPVIMTFDDGRKEQIQAAEMMRKYRMRGIFFVIPSRITSGRPDFMNKEDLATLASQGHQIGVHGYSHRSMAESPEEVEDVRTRSRGILQEAVPSQHSFPHFAYPFGHYDSSVVSIAGKIYRYLHTVNPGYWDRRSQQLPRMLITSDKPIGFFQNYVRLAPQFKPSLISLTPDGGQANLVAFRIVDPMSIPEIEVMAVSSDRDGYLYTSRPCANVVAIQKLTLVFDLQKFLKLYFQDSRKVLSYAFMRNNDSSFYYLSTGQSNWVIR